MPSRRDVLIGLVALWPAVLLRAEPGDDTDIYRLAINAVVFGLSSRSRLAVGDTAIDMTPAWENGAPRFGAPYLHPRTRITYAKAETVEAFIIASGRRSRLPEALKKSPEFLVVPEGTIRRIESAEPNHRLVRQNRLRGPVSAQVSGIGFDGERSEALVYVNYTCGSSCGSGTIVKVSRNQAGVWAVTHRDQYIMS